MGRRGPPKKPTKLKKLHGTVRRKDLDRNEPKPNPLAPECPDWLPGEAKTKWKELAPEMERLGLLTSLDGPAFSMLLLHWFLAVDAARRITAEGLVSKDERELPRKHPLGQVLRDNSQMFGKYATEFGLSPSTREHLDIQVTRSEKDEIIREYFTPGG